MEKKELVAMLVNVYFSESGYGDRLLTPPLGIGYISEFLDSKSIPHRVIDMGLGYFQDDIVAEVQEHNPAVIGFSINSLCMDKTSALLKAVKKASPKTLVVVGGPHVSTLRSNIFKDCPSADFAIIGEGEESFYQILRGVPSEDISGLIYRDATGNVHENTKRITENLDSLPFPKFKKFELDKYQEQSIPILSSRGCPFKCVFCQQSSLLSKNWRGKSARAFVKEIQYWNEQGYTAYQILDDNFVFDADRLKEIHHLFKTEDLGDIRIDIVGGVRIGEMTKEKMTMLKDLGVDLLSFGIESFSDKVLKFIKKGTQKKQIDKIIHMATEMGFKVRLFFIIGLPFETMETIEDMFAFAVKYPVYQVRFFNLVPYEGTLLMDYIDKNGEMLYEYSNYMNHYKKFQDIPLFTAKDCLSPAQRESALKRAFKLIQTRFDGR